MYSLVTAWGSTVAQWCVTPVAMVTRVSHFKYNADRVTHLNNRRAKLLRNISSSRGHR